MPKGLLAQKTDQCQKIKVQGVVMKKVAIVTALFIPLVNSMDYQERALEINGRNYIGYSLHENESPPFCCVGIRQDTSFNFLTQNQEIYIEIAVQGRYNQAYYALCKLPSNSTIGLYEDPYMLRCFFLTSPSYSATKAFSLLHLYTSTHIKRTFTLQNSSLLSYEESSR